MTPPMVLSAASLCQHDLHVGKMSLKEEQTTQSARSKNRSQTPASLASGRTRELLPPCSAGLRSADHRCRAGDAGLPQLQVIEPGPGRAAAQATQADGSSGSEARSFPGSKGLGHSQAPRQEGAGGRAVLGRPWSSTAGREQRRGDSRIAVAGSPGCSCGHLQGAQPAGFTGPGRGGVLPVTSPKKRPINAGLPVFSFTVTE